MYNRYTPQTDGTYCRKRVPEPMPKAAPKPQPPTPQPVPPPLPCPVPIHQQKPPRPPEKPPRPHQPKQVGNFLKDLLPGNFDTADLIILLLLLLLAGDCEEDRNTAMLTLVLYLFM